MNVLARLVAKVIALFFGSLNYLIRCSTITSTRIEKSEAYAQIERFEIEQSRFDKWNRHIPRY